MTPTRLKCQKARFAKVRGNSGIATLSATEFTAQRNDVITNLIPVSLGNYLDTVHNAQRIKVTTFRVKQ
jgi:hypothetical protein